MAVKSLPVTPETSDGAGFLGGDLGSQPGSERGGRARRPRNQGSRHQRPW